MAGNYATATAIAKLLEITPRHLQRLVTDGVVPRYSRGKYELVPVVQAYVRYLRDQTTGGEVGPGDPTREIQSLKAERLRMEVAQDKGELLPAMALESYAAQVGAVMHAGLESLPGQFKQICPWLRSAELKQVRTVIAKLQNGIAAVDLSHPRAA